jgi:hypothetical protein
VNFFHHYLFYYTLVGFHISRHITHLGWETPVFFTLFTLSTYGTVVSNSNEEKTNDYENFEKGMIYMEILKKGG